MVGSDARLEAAEWDIFIVIWDVVSGPSGGVEPSTFQHPNHHPNVLGGKCPAITCQAIFPQWQIGRAHV